MYGGILKGNVVEMKPAVLASRGFATLALAFFGVDDLPKTYVNGVLELDYFEEAVDLLMGIKEVQKERGVGIMGISKAGDIALTMAAYLPSNKIAATVVINCMANSLVSDVVYKGKKILSKLKISNTEIAKVKQVENMENVFSISEIFDDINFEQDLSSIIPFAKSQSDILLIGGLDDKLARPRRQIEFAKRLLEKEENANCTIKEYEGLGHFVDLPYDPPCTIAGHPLLPYPLKVLYGGDNRKMHASDQEKVWHDTLNFFRKLL